MERSRSKGKSQHETHGGKVKYQGYQYSLILDPVEGNLSLGEVASCKVYEYLNKTHTIDICYWAVPVVSLHGNKRTLYKTDRS